MADEAVDEELFAGFELTQDRNVYIFVPAEELPARVQLGGEGGNIEAESYFAGAVEDCARCGPGGVIGRAVFSSMMLLRVSLRRKHTGARPLPQEVG